MPRAPRIDIPGFTYHITNRGVKQLPIFHADEDRQQFLRFLLRTREVFPFRLHAYSLLTNHYHLLLETIHHSLSAAMHYFGSLFAAWMNRKYAHAGHVFQGRFHSPVVDTDSYFITVASYIHNNAPRAGIVQRPEDYAWCDYGRLVRGETDALVDHTLLLSHFGATPGRERERYKQHVEEQLKKQELVTQRVLQRMRYWGRPPVVMKK